MGEHEGDLAEAEREFRQAVPNSWGDTEVADWALVTLLAEYNRRGSALAAVEAERDALQADVERLRARTHEIQENADKRNAGLAKQVGYWTSMWEYSEAETREMTDDVEGRATAPDWSWWRMTSYRNRSVILRLVRERREALAARDRVLAGMDRADEASDSGLASVLTDDVRALLAVPGETEGEPVHG